MEYRLFQEAQETIQREVRAAVGMAARGEVSQELLAEQLRREFPNARQCGSCGHGPIDHFACGDLNAHHGERHGAAQISNSCPRCGWRVAPIDEWPNWDGQMR